MKPIHIASAVTAAILWVIGSAYLIQIETARAAVDWVVVYSTPAIWAAVIAAPIFAHHAWKEGRFVIAPLLLLAAVVGSAYMLNGTIGRQAELRDVKVNEAAAASAPSDLLKLELQEAKTAKANAVKKGEKACKTDVDSDACTAFTARENAAQRLIDATIAKIGAVPAAKPVNSGAKLVTTAIVLISGLFGSLTENVAGLWVATFSPALLGMFLELATMGCAGYAFAAPISVPASVPAVKAVAPVVLASVPVSVPAIAAPVIDPDVASVMKALKGIKGPVTNGELAERMGIVKSESSKRVAVALAAGVVTKDVVGREVRIALA